MKTRTTLTGLFVMLARPFLDALRDEWQAWTRATHGTSDNSPDVTKMMQLAPKLAEAVPVAVPEPTVTISIAAAVEPAPCIGEMTTHATEPVALSTPAPAVGEQPLAVAIPEPVITVAAGVKCEPKKPAKRTSKPALAMAGASRTTTKKPRKPSRTEPAGKLPEGSGDDSSTSAKPRKPATRAKRTPACSTA